MSKKMSKLIAFVFTPILLTSAGEFLLKKTINQLNLIHETLEVWVLLGSAPLLLAIGMIITGGVLWLVAMSKFQVSYIYPFLSINYFIIFLGSNLILDEVIPVERIFALSLIVLGLIVISKSPNLEK